jgi:hypothetical protein
MTNPFDDTEEGDAVNSVEDSTHYISPYVSDLRKATQILLPLCGDKGPTHAITNLPERVTCRACKAMLANAPPPPEDP